MQRSVRLHELGSFTYKNHGFTYNHFRKNLQSSRTAVLNIIHQTSKQHNSNQLDHNPRQKLFSHLEQPICTAKTATLQKLSYSKRKSKRNTPNNLPPTTKKKVPLKKQTKLPQKNTFSAPKNLLPTKAGLPAFEPSRGARPPTSSSVGPTPNGQWA